MHIDSPFMTDNASLPFQLTHESMASWLKSLSSLAPAVAANQLNLTLKQLVRTDADANALLPLLINLSPLALHLSNSLANLARAEPQGKAYKIAKLAVQLLRHLSLALCRAIESKQLATETVPTAIFHALHLIGYCQRNSALFYEPPSATLWKKTALLYQIAEKKNWLQQEIAGKFADLKQPNSIEGVVKRNLLFAIFAPNRYAVAEIEPLFKLAAITQPLLETSMQPSQGPDFYWELKDSEPCPAKRGHWQTSRGMMAICTQRLGHALRLGEISSELPQTTVSKLTQHLCCYDQLFATVDLKPPILPARFFPGLGSVQAYLASQDKLSKIMRLSGQTASRNVLRDMSLVPLEHEKNFYKPSTGHVSNFNNQPGFPVTLLRNHSKQFVVAESSEGAFCTGDIGMLSREQQAPRLMLVRRQAAFEDTSLIAFEPVIGELSIHDIAGDGGKTVQAVLVTDENHSEVFLPKGKYALESKIALPNGTTLLLKSCLEFNEYYARFRVTLDS
ncbi:hypothetical protein [Methylomonas koyamae]|uniref:Uncharacterized protein n=2 Tax=Methylomonas koyamae TaxID=702114 RepID=A0AA91DF67_9GAMM|nr:hypothetical protein [Methylomonas koyamae]OAI27797.1 hypothetical protein A1356_08870 [Methylomonas koyamae]